MGIVWTSKVAELAYRFPFKITHGTRHSTPAVFLEIKLGKSTGYGEATLPPYLKENTESVLCYLRGTAWDKLQTDKDIEKFVFSSEQANHSPCGQTIIEMALLDLLGKRQNKNLTQILNIKQHKSSHYSAYTLSLDDEDSWDRRLAVAQNFSFFKIKLTGQDDEKQIDFIQAKVKGSLIIDANQAWHDPEKVLVLIKKLKSIGAIAIEQPMPVNHWDEYKWVKERSELPIIADESVQFDTDIEKIAQHFHGINIKPLKFGGIVASHKVILQAKKLGLLIQLGCMSESSLGCTYNAALLDYADFVDLDGPLLLGNDPFVGITFADDGLIRYPIHAAGIGAGLKNPNFYSPLFP